MSSCVFRRLATILRVRWKHYGNFFASVRNSIFLMTLYSLHARRLSSLFRRRHFRTFFARASSARVYLRLRGLRAPSPCRMRSPEAPPSTKYFTPAIGHRRRRSSITTSDVPLPLLCDKAVVTKATPVGGWTEAERANKQKTWVCFAPRCDKPRYEDRPSNLHYQRQTHPGK